MAKGKMKDTEYLYLSAYIHARENNIIGAERLERMLEARSPEEALKILEDAGWRVPDGCDAVMLEGLLSKRRDEAFTDMGSLAPNPAIVDIFRIRYDYHNAKCLIKAAAVGADASAILSKAGRVPADKISRCFLEDSLSALPKALGDAMAKASDTLARTGDPQLADFILDEAYYAEFAEEAERSSSAFLQGYAELSIDAANLKSLVRAFRMNRDESFIKRVIMDGGSVKTIYVIAALGAPETALELYGNTALSAAVEPAKAALAGKGITELEKICDDTLNAYMSGAKLSPFGEKPLIGYLSAIEAEINAVRMVMTGQFAHIPADVTRRSLREGV